MAPSRAVGLWGGAGPCLCRLRLGGDAAGDGSSLRGAGAEACCSLGLRSQLLYWVCLAAAASTSVQLLAAQSWPGLRAPVLLAAGLCFLGRQGEQPTERAGRRMVLEGGGTPGCSSTQPAGPARPYLVLRHGAPGAGSLGLLPSNRPTGQQARVCVLSRARRRMWLLPAHCALGSSWQLSTMHTRGPGPGRHGCGCAGCSRASTRGAPSLLIVPNAPGQLRAGRVVVAGPEGAPSAAPLALSLRAQLCGQGLEAARGLLGGQSGFQALAAHAGAQLEPRACLSWGWVVCPSVTCVARVFRRPCRPLARAALLTVHERALQGVGGRVCQGRAAHLAGRHACAVTSVHGARRLPLTSDLLGSAARVNP